LRPNPAQLGSSEVSGGQWYTTDFEFESDPVLGAQDGIIKMDSIIGWHCQGWYGGGTHRQVTYCQDKSFGADSYAEMEIRS
jgi:hypothetical protein